MEVLLDIFCGFRLILLMLFFSIFFSEVVCLFLLCELIGCISVFFDSSVVVLIEVVMFMLISSGG